MYQAWVPRVPLINQARYLCNPRDERDPRANYDNVRPGALGGEPKPGKQTKKGENRRARESNNPRGKGGGKGGIHDCQGHREGGGKGGRGDPESLTRPWYRTNLSTRAPRNTT